MKKALVTSFGLVAFFLAQRAQGVIGYINEVYAPGYNFFCNQLDGSPDNTANSILSSMIPTAPAGTALTEWTGTAWAPYSFFNGSSWSINYNLALGQGAVLFTKAYFTNTFVGQVSFASPPARTDGLYFIGDITPIGGAGFSDVVGRGPQNGESVTQFNPSTQSFSTETYVAGDGWVNDSHTLVPAPSLGVTEAAFFGLGTLGGTLPSMPPLVPEPGIGALLLVGAAFLRFPAGRRNA